MKDCAREAKDRPSIEEFLGLQRRFHHLVQQDATGLYVARAGKEDVLRSLRMWTQSNVERLYRLAELQ